MAYKTRALKSFFIEMRTKIGINLSLIVETVPNKLKKIKIEVDRF